MLAAGYQILTDPGCCDRSGLLIVRGQRLLATEASSDQGSDRASARASERPSDIIDQGSNRSSDRMSYRVGDRASG